jgi:hypothetical protein
MLNITSNAARICSETVRQLSVSAKTKLPRFNKDGSSVSLSLEPPQGGDEIVYFKDKAVLAVPDEIGIALSGMTLDLKENGIFVLT